MRISDCEESIMAVFVYRSTGGSYPKMGPVFNNFRYQAMTLPKYIAARWVSGLVVFHSQESNG